MDETQFHDNIAKWSKKYPKAAIFVPYADCSPLLFCNTKAGELNLKVVGPSSTQFYHSNENVSKSAQEWFSTLDLSNTLVLYVFGVGLGYVYDAAKEWLKGDFHRSLVFLENDLAVIHRLFETERAHDILFDPQVQLHYFDNLKDKKEELAELYWTSITTQIQIVALPYYAETKTELFEQLQHKLAHDATTRHALLDEYLQYGIVFYRNFYHNMLMLDQSAIGDTMEGKFKGIPAIICGAGPSLSKQLPLLKTLTDRALIFAGGSSLNALNSFGIQPHLGAGIDPNAEQLKRIQDNCAFELPFLFRTRLEQRACRAVRGPHIYISGSGGYDTSDWYEEKLGIEGKGLEEGFNVVNFCMEVARLWGCNPIIFVGMDLAFTNMQTYAQGVISDNAITTNELLNSTDLEEKAFPKPDIYGNPVYTLWKWIAESQWIGEFAENNPKLSLINATEGGIGFPNIPNKPFKEVAFPQQYELHDRLYGEIQNATPKHITHDELVSLTKELRESLVRCQEHLSTIISETDITIKKIQETKNVPNTLQSGLAALAETELSEEIGYSAVLMMFHVVYSKILSRDLKHIQRQDLPEWQKTASRLTLNNKKLQYLLNTSHANIKMIDNALEEVGGKKGKGKEGGPAP
ncbi:MAG: motility associated factor glycosyltransferase family protein [Parachlamydiaceae bacterium]|nr:motility associated factor glycosyltransferase family protein [Parachlamydiaceae bacterium]